MIGPIAFLWQRQVQRRDDWLRTHGVRVFADFAGVEQNPQVRINGQSPWRIVCQWPDPMTHRLRFYRSHNLWYDPRRYITCKTMEVFVHPSDPHRYLVETSFLPKLLE